MALQRTRRPRLRSGRSLRSLGSPLNAYPLGARRYVLLVGILFLFRALALGDPTVRLGIFAPTCIGTCPGVVPQRTIANSGQFFQIFVVALDNAGFADPRYSGTVFFSSSDSLATLPQSTAFTAADEGSRLFEIAFRTVGTQTITVTDQQGTVLPGSFSISILGPSAVEGIPALSSLELGLLALGLACVGLLYLHESGSGA